MKRVLSVMRAGPVVVPALAAFLGLLFLQLPDSRAGSEAKPSAGERTVYLLYTVNNLGYTDTCG